MNIELRDAEREAAHTKHSHADGHHGHGVVRSAELATVSDRRLLWTVALNQLLTVGQVVAGIFSGSVALLSDAAHNFNDANALLIAYIARRVARKGADERYTFGYRRAEMIGALVNLTLLAVIGLYLVYEATKRFFQPEDVVGWLMAAAAVLALVIDVATAALLWAMSKGSLNVRAAFVHNIVDALGSVAVLVGAAAIIWLDWVWVDPAITLLIAGYVLWQVVVMFPQATRVLMEGAPPDLNVQQVVERMKGCEGVLDTHHLHVWQLDEDHVALEAHVVVEGLGPAEAESAKQRVKKMLAIDFGVAHATLELEYRQLGVEPCDDQKVVANH